MTSKVIYVRCALMLLITFALLQFRKGVLETASTVPSNAAGVQQRRRQERRPEQHEQHDSVSDDGLNGRIDDSPDRLSILSKRKDYSAVMGSSSRTSTISSKEISPATVHSAYESTSYTIQRTRGSGWTPKLNLIKVATNFHNSSSSWNPSFETLFFQSNNKDSSLAAIQSQQQGPFVRKQDILVFVRVPKTGSTSLMGFLRRCQGLYNEAAFLDDHGFKIHNPNLGCAYGFLSPNQKIPIKYNIKEWRCGHIQLERLLKGVTKPLDNWKGRQSIDFDMISFHPFAMVRDPFDQMKSLFNYIYKFRDSELWKTDFTMQQYQKVLDNDFAGWIESLHRNGTLYSESRMFSQMTFFSNDLTTAKELVQKGRILILVTECFNVSIKLLVAVFPHMFFKKQIKSFLSPHQSQEEDGSAKSKRLDFLHANSNEHHHYNTSKTTIEVDLTSMLRSKAMFEWFPEQYEFHQILIERFQKDVKMALHLPGTLLTETEVDQCFTTLKEKRNMVKRVEETKIPHSHLFARGYSNPYKE